jgi:hypothetical protein
MLNISEEPIERLSEIGKKLKATQPDREMLCKKCL